MDIQSSMYSAAIQQPNSPVTDRTVPPQQAENESVSTRPVERVNAAEESEPLVLGGNLDVFA